MPKYSSEEDFMTHDLQIVNGQVVERDALRIAEKVHELNPDLYVQVLDAAPSMLGEPPFRVVERCKDGKHRILFSCWTLDDTVIARIRMADMSQQDILKRLERNNAAVRLNEKKAIEAQNDETNEIAYAVMKSPLSKYTAPVNGENVTFFEDRPAERK